MKTSKRKQLGRTIAIGICCLIGIFVIVFVANSLKKQGVPVKNDLELRVFAGGLGDIAGYDTAHIRYIHEYNVLVALYSPLVEFSNDGQLIAGLAKEFYWQGSDAIFEIRDDAVGSDGLPITASDASFSLKRLLILGKNTHGDLRDFLCLGEELRTAQDSCSSIVVEKNRLILKLPKKKTFLFPVLATIDYAIIPERSVDPKTLKIRDFAVTSGPYSVESSKHDEIKFKANPKHWHFNIKMAHKVVMSAPKSDSGKPLTGVEHVTAFASGEYDVLPTYEFGASASLVELAQTRADVTLHTTQPIGVSALRFSQRGLSELSAERRIAIGKTIRAAYKRRFEGNKFNRKPATEFFSPVGEGGLSPSQKDALAQKFESVPDATDGRGIKLVVALGAKSSVEKTLMPVLPGLEVIGGKVWKSGQDEVHPGGLPHMAIIVTDTSAQEDISLLNYSLSAGYFPYSQDANKEWLKNYTDIEDKEERLVKLRQLHFDMLSTPSVVPISSMPYYAVAKKPWVMGFSELYAGGPFWQILRQD